jgi:hypothetical protein
MTARIDVEDVLSKLTIAEKVSLLAGEPLSPHTTSILLKNFQVTIGGILLLSLNMASQRSVSPTAQTVSEEPNSSTAPKPLVSHAAQLLEQHGTQSFCTKLALPWAMKAKPKALM